MKRLLCCLLALLAMAATLRADGPAAPLALHEKPADDDLAVSGAFTGLAELTAGGDLKAVFEGMPDRTTRYVGREQLLALPEVRVIAEEPFARMGVHQCTVLFWKDLLAHLPLKPGADCIRIECADKWESVYRRDFIERWNPYILLLVDGKTLDAAVLPPPFDKVRLAPYAMNVSGALFPSFKYSGVGGADPIKAVGIIAANYDEYYKPWFSGQYMSINRQGAAGREIFLNQCATCHAGPGGACGGHLSTRDWDYLVVQATGNRPYFVNYVRNPQKYLPGVAMPKHEGFTDETFDRLVAFLGAGSAAAR